jgi:hypothetical protein
MWHPHLTIAAVEIRLIVFVVMAILAFISWISRQIAAAREKAPPPPRRSRRNPNDPLRNEVQMFLEEVDSKPRNRDDDVLIEVVPDDEVVRRQRQRPQPQRRPPGQGRPPQGAPGTSMQGMRPTAARPSTQPNAPRPNAGTAARTPPALPAKSSERQRPGGQIQTQAAAGTSSLGGGVRSHLQEYMGGRIDQQVKEHLAGAVDKSVSQHLGAQGATAPDQSATGQEHPIVRILRSPGGVRQAVLISEILTPKYKRPRA